MERLARWYLLVVNFLLAPFHAEAKPRRVVAVVECCRVVLGVILVYQAIDVLGFVTVFDPKAGKLARIALVTLFASAGLTVGFMTPWMLLALIVQYGLRTLTCSLGDQTTVITLWLLFLLGAGRHASADRLLTRLLPGYDRWMYWFAVDPACPRGVAWVRLIGVLLYWGVCLVAMGFHFFDAFWWRGEALQVAMTGPYFSYHHHLWAALAEAQPGLYQLLCASGLGVQAFWEVFLLPLMYFRWGRWFVLVQGLAFFLISLTCLNLQALPYVEFVLWAVLFGTGWALVPVDPAPAFRPRLVHGFALLAAVLVGLHMAHCPLALRPDKSIPYSQAYQTIRPFFWLLGQRPVNVFNRNDMDTNACWIVLREVDASGRHLRVVPYMDAEGGRLRYMRNDLLYFTLSIRWHRISREARFNADANDYPFPFTLDYARRVALLDARLTRGHDGPRYYRAEVFRRDLLEDRSPPAWTPPRHECGWSMRFTPTDLSSFWWPAYDLPPGFWDDGQRLRMTEEYFAARPLVIGPGVVKATDPEE